MSKYKDDFAPESIPILIEAQKLQKQSKYESPKEPLTIRQAQWIARLYPLITEIYVRRYSVELDELRKPVNKEYLWMVWVIADIYVLMEKSGEIIGKEYLDTPDLDEEFFITESYWDLPVPDRASFTIASRMLYDAVQKDWKDDKVKKHGNKDKFPGKEEAK